jgi:hypothetical protein
MFATSLPPDSERTASPGPPSSLADSLARTLAQRVRALVSSTANALDSGVSSHGSLATYDPATSSWRTWRRSFTGDWTAYAETWPRWGMTRHGQLTALTPWVPRIDGSGSSSWPTPAACNPNDGEGLGTWLERRDRLKATHRNGNGCGTPLAIAAQMWPSPWVTDGSKDGPNQRGSKGDLMLPSAVQMWPTPSGAAAKQGQTEADGKRGQTLVGAAREQDWPTPTTQDAHNTGSQSQQARNTPPLNAAVGGCLNPAFVEMLMGFPVGWTDVD